MNNDGDYAFDMFLSDWHSELGGLIFGLGEFLITFNGLERNMKDLLANCFEIPNAKKTAFRESVLEQNSFGRLIGILKTVLISSSFEEQANTLIPQIRELVRQRNEVVHELSGINDSDTSSPPYLTRISSRLNGLESRVSESQMLELIDRCVSLNREITDLSSAIHRATDTHISVDQDESAPNG